MSRLQPARGECVSDTRIAWSIGPFHSSLPGAFRLLLQLNGEDIDSAAVELGFARRGLERVICRQDWQHAVAIAGKVDAESAIFGEWVYCLAVEKGLGVSVPERAQVIRVLLAEISRMSSHLKNLSLIARAAESESAFHFMLREREYLLDLMELATGSRHSPNFLRLGGVHGDVSEGFLESLQAACQRVLDRVSEYNDQLTYSESFVRRVSGRTVIDEDVIRKHGISGVPARAFDPESDLRWKGFPGYDSIRYRAPQLTWTSVVPGDLHHRFVLKLHEIVQTAQFLYELAQHVPGGDYRASCDTTKVPAGTFIAEVEAPRGRLKVSVLSSGGRTPEQVKFITPSESLFAAIPDFLPGESLEDLSLALASADLEVAEVDR
ncbi:MAG: hypothetical protein KGQ59_09710 [Bdellovibrionales bacterium]|nr:hypothetical protein [Bdellovibrionales bacterium]